VATRVTHPLVTPAQIERIHSTTDAFQLHRDFVVIPLKSAPDAGRELVMPDGKLLVRPPAPAAFDAWFAGLADRLAHLDLAKVPRRPRR
jgi:hypothetical protein